MRYTASNHNRGGCVIAVLRYEYIAVFDIKIVPHDMF